MEAERISRESKVDNKRKRKLPLLMKRLNKMYERPVISGPERHDFFKQQSVECDLDDSLINVKSKTSLLDKLQDLRMFENRNKLVNFKAVKKYHATIAEEIKKLIASVDVKNPMLLEPPDLKMIRRILMNGYTNAAKRLIELINLEIDIKYDESKNENGMKITNENSLERNFPLIRTLLLLFKKADKFKDMNKIEEQATIYLYLAIYFDRKDWLWLSNELYSLALHACEGYRLDEGITEATIRYMWARMTMLGKHALDEGIKHLEVVCELSAGRSWSASAFSGIKDDYIYPAANRLLYLSHIALVSESHLSSSSSILWHLQQAAIQSSTEEEYRDILLPLADAYLIENNPDDAIAYLKEFISIAKRNSNHLPENMLLTNINFLKFLNLRLFYYNIRRENDFHAIEYLYNFYRLAKKENDRKGKALAYKYYGYLYLNQGQVGFAYCLLRRALVIFTKIRDKKNFLEIISIILYYTKAIEVHKQLSDKVRKKLCKSYNQAIDCKISESVLYWDATDENLLRTDSAEYVTQSQQSIPSQNILLKKPEKPEALNKYEEFVLKVDKKKLLKSKLDIENKIILNLPCLPNYLLREDHQYKVRGSKKKRRKKRKIKKNLKKPYLKDLPISQYVGAHFFNKL